MTTRLARPGSGGAKPSVVVQSEVEQPQKLDGGHPAHPTDGRDQLGDGVLGGHGIVKQRRVEGPACLSLQSTPFASMTERTALQMRCGSPEVRNLVR